MVTVCHHTSLLNDVVLGYIKVGVTVLTILKNEYFPTLESGDVNLVSWKITAVRNYNTRTFLEDHIEEAHHDPKNLDEFEATLI
jgi:hypothetical protein